MKLADLGYNDFFDRSREDLHLTHFEIGRVISEHKERYIVRTALDEFEAKVTGHLRFSATGREDFPAVGDWVALSTFDSGFSLIHHILPRKSLISRQAVGQFGEVQIIATNIDYGFIVQAVDRDFNVNRLERYLTLCFASKVLPIIVLTKVDLIDDLQKAAIVNRIREGIAEVPVHFISNNTQLGYTALQRYLEMGKTCCLLGSSGVGKSSLMNNLAEQTLMITNTISLSTSKGRHITSHRELIILPQGGILVDNPGMREVGIVDTANGLETTFDTILAYSQQCKFKDCTHTNEKGCAVLGALNNGEIELRSYNNYLKMEKEKSHFESSVMERRKKDKAFGKMVKSIKNEKDKRK